MLAVWLVACLFVFHLFYENAREEAIADLNARQMIHMKQAAKAIEGYFEHWISLLRSTAKRDSIIALNDEGKDQMEFILSNHEKGIMGISRVDEEGRIVHSLPLIRSTSVRTCPARNTFGKSWALINPS